MMQIYAMRESFYSPDEEPYCLPVIHVASREVAEQIIAGLLGKPCGQWPDGEPYRGIWREDDFDILELTVR